MKQCNSENMYMWNTQMQAFINIGSMAQTQFVLHTLIYV